jgi:biotin transporter BioY
MTEPWVIGGLSALIGACSIATFVMISKFVGSKEKWNEIKDKSPAIWNLSLFGSIALFLAGLIYFNIDNNHEKIMYFIFTLAFIAMGLAVSAMGVALIHKNAA